MGKARAVGALGTTAEDSERLHSQVIMLTQAAPPMESTLPLGSSEPRVLIQRYVPGNHYSRARIVIEPSGNHKKKRKKKKHTPKYWLMHQTLNLEDRREG